MKLKYFILICLFFTIFKDLSYSQNWSHPYPDVYIFTPETTNYISNLGDSEIGHLVDDTIYIGDKMYIYTPVPKYDTLFIPYGISKIIWDSSGSYFKQIGERYLILSDIIYSCPSCGSKETFTFEGDLSERNVLMKMRQNNYDIEIIICNNCGNIYLSRKQILKRIE